MINSLFILPYHLPLRHPWVTSHGTINNRAGFLVEISEQDSVAGLGDAAPLPEMGSESLEQCRKTLELLKEEADNISVDDLLARLPDLRNTSPAACCGVESALITILAKRCGLTPGSWISPNATNKIRVNHPAGTLAKATEPVDGESVIKVKVGLSSIDEEVAQLYSLAATLPQHTEIRLDANQAWSITEASQFISAIQALPMPINIESLEEPLKNPTLETINKLQRETPFPLALDESVSDFGVETLLKNEQLQRVVLKPALMGGPYTTFKIATQFKERGVDVIITSALESSVGIISAAYCAGAVDPEQRHAHGLATSSLLAEDLMLALPIKNGILTLP
ncbi:MAG: o-succinylbenzoate synthase [Gammaproteobacteria bacterium]|nr:o-succinylbenzoate synthase [Gammaproteobacteria bacterium]